MFEGRLTKQGFLVNNDRTETSTEPILALVPIATATSLDVFSADKEHYPVIFQRKIDLSKLPINKDWFRLQLKVLSDDSVYNRDFTAVVELFTEPFTLSGKHRRR